MNDIPKVGKDLEVLLRLAYDQGWVIKPCNGGKIGWYGPNGEGPVFSPLRAVGRGLKNLQGNLQRAGLDTSPLKVEKAKEALEKFDQPEGTHINLAKALLSEDLPFDAPAMTETVRELTAKDDGTFDEAMSAYLGDVSAALARFIDTSKLAGEGSQALAEAERLYVEADERCKELEQTVENMKETIKNVCIQRDQAKKAEAAALDRAIKAENKMNTLKNLFKD